MSIFNRGREKFPTFIYSPNYIPKLFNTDGSENTSVKNSEVYPDYIAPWVGNFFILNYGSGDIAEDIIGNHPTGWLEGKRNKTKVDEIVDAYPRHMLKNLVLAAGVDGTPVPVAGAYFTKLLDHTPGEVQPLSCLITGSDGKINELSIVGTLSLSGGSDADTALNTFGKNNEIDCGFIPEE